MQVPGVLLQHAQAIPARADRRHPQIVVDGTLGPGNCFRISPRNQQAQKARAIGQPGMGLLSVVRRFRSRLPDGLGMRPEQRKQHATSSFEPTWIMTVSFSLRWSGRTAAEFRMIWFHGVFQTWFRHRMIQRPLWCSGSMSGDRRYRTDHPHVFAAHRDGASGL
jgi:hypothetical protein